MAKLIEMVVSVKGEITLQTKGYFGAECQQASRWLEQALGIATKDRKTAAFFQNETTQQQEAHE